VDMCSCASVWKACRGTDLDPGMEELETADATGESEKPAGPQRIPIEADFLYAYATVPGTVDQMLALLNEWQSANASSINHCMFHVVDRVCY